MTEIEKMRQLFKQILQTQALVLKTLEQLITTEIENNTSKPNRKPLEDIRKALQETRQAATRKFK